MNNKPSAWFHSWYVDTLCLHSIPLIFALLAVFDLPPFRRETYGTMITMVTWIIVIDWAHIFAQWYRIYSNPVESPRMKVIYPVSYFLLIPVLACIVHYTTRFPVERFLIYYVIYHFIKQHYGYTRIYAKIDGAKTKIQNLVEDVFIYSTMVVPVIYWHVSFPYTDFLWKVHFFKHDFFQYLFYAGAFVYGASFVLYGYFEYVRYKKNGYSNIAKNLAILAPAVGWGCVSFASDTFLLIFFTVVLTHDMSYTCFVWLIGRRDQMKTNKKIPWQSWFSIPGAMVYLVTLIVGAQVVLVIHHRLVGHHVPNLIFGNLFSGIPHVSGWVESFGIAIFFATQAHHYFIDRYLWKKEKDLDYMVKTGRFQLSDLS